MYIILRLLLFDGEVLMEGSAKTYSPASPPNRQKKLQPRLNFELEKLRIATQESSFESIKPTQWPKTSPQTQKQ